MSRVRANLLLAGLTLSFFKYIFVKRPQSKKHQSILEFVRLMRQIADYNDTHSPFPASCPGSFV